MVIINSIHSVYKKYSYHLQIQLQDGSCLYLVVIDNNNTWGMAGSAMRCEGTELGCPGHTPQSLLQVGVYIYFYVCIHVRLFLCVFFNIHLCINIPKCIHIHLYFYVFFYIHLCINIPRCIHIHLFLSIYIYI